MKRGPMVHGVLLVAALLWAYQTYTREDTAEPKTGEFQVWSHDSVQAIAFESERRSVRVEHRRDDKGAEYLWGVVVRTTPKPTPPKPPVPAGGDAGPAARPPEPEMETKTQEFPVGEAGEELIKNFKELRALRNLGPLSDEQKKDFGVADSKDSLTVSFGGKASRSLIVGGRVYGGSDRYVLDPDSGRGYVLSAEVLRSLEGAEASLRLRELHAYKDEKVARAAVELEGGKRRELVKKPAKDGKAEAAEADMAGKPAEWADAAAPDKVDQTLANFLDRVGRLVPIDYDAKVQPSALSRLVVLRYRDDKGKDLGYLELYRSSPKATPAAAEPGKPATPAGAPTEPGKPATPAGAAAQPGKPATPPADPHGHQHGEDGHDHGTPPASPEAGKPPAPEVEYYIRTEQTRVLGKVSKLSAERVEQDLKELFK
jgi:hypothetical protein